MTTILLCLISLATGILIGWRGAWMRVERVWLRDPYKFKAIVEGVIELREGQLQPLEQEKERG